MIAVKKPTLIIDESRVRKNIRKIKHKTDAAGIHLRPHFKTHQSKDVAGWFREEGVSRITVSSVSMASYFAENGWKDITIAFPYNPLEIEDINSLNDQIKLQVLIESPEALEHLKSNIANPISYFIKLDVGTHRTGLEPNQLDLIRLLTESTEKTQYQGILAHTGHTYGARGTQEILETHQKAMDCISDIREELGFDMMISYGDTPSASVLNDFNKIDEVRAGNFTYYDLMQEQIGSCDMDEIAVALAVPIVAKHPSRDEVVVYGGAVHLSKDRIEYKGQTIFGIPVIFNETGWTIIPNCFVPRLSQEHGIIHMPAEMQDKFQIGDILGILPVHSCLTADMMTAQQTLEGKKVEKMQKI